MKHGRVEALPDVQSAAAAAMEQFHREWPYLSQGRTPPAVLTDGGCEMRTLCNAFLTFKRNRVIAGELTERAFMDLRKVTDLLIAEFKADRRVDDLRPDDFEYLRKSLASRLGPVRLKNVITHDRGVFKFAFDHRLVSAPINYGQAFNRPTARTLRRSRNVAGPKLFERPDLTLILAALAGEKVTVDDKELTFADTAMRAMVLLGLNCGFGNSDIASLPRSALDLSHGWVTFPRPKTEIERRVPLWPETIAALRDALPLRPDAEDAADAGLCFLTWAGRRWVRMQATKDVDDISRKCVALDPLGQRFRKLLKSLKLDRRPGLGFYTLRHVFQTIGGECRDQVAVNSLMGHVDESMAAAYRERISDERLRNVTETVRRWLFPEVLSGVPIAGGEPGAGTGRSSSGEGTP